MKAERRISARVVSLLAAVVLAISAASFSVSAKQQRPKLVVILVVDQMRADYVERFSSTWHGGLHRLITEGARFTNAFYPYANTVTCAGHSTISTGDLPSTHGMIANDWYERDTNSRVTCVTDPKATLIEYGAGTPATNGKGESAWRMLAPSVAEQIRKESPGSRVVTMSLKARSAATLAGHTADAVTWLEANRWVTSTAYETARVPEVQEYVIAHPIEDDASKTWTGPAAGSATDPSGERLSSGFPHVLSTSGTADGAFYNAWEASPYSDAYLEAMGESLADSMKLGRRGPIDVLAISFSALDLVGHRYGPDSAEIRDVLLQLDGTIGRLFDHLDKTVGPENYVVALSADHGVAPIPELALQKGMDAGRADILAVKAQVELALAPYKLGEDPISSFQDMNLYFKTGVAEKLKNHPDAMKAVIAAIKTVPGIAAAFPGDALAKDASTNALAKAANFSYYAGRSGDLIVITKPYWFLYASSGGKPSGTTHGSPYDYDQHVPLLLMGTGVRAKTDPTAASPADIAPTLAKLCGIPIAHTDGHALPLR
ncbi:MAG: alkaline phosphatase family protein [Candidatus Acidiferrales bacterium]